MGRRQQKVAIAAANAVVKRRMAKKDLMGTRALSDLTLLQQEMSTSNLTVTGPLTVTTTTGAVILPRMTTTQRNALTAAAGMMVYNTTDSKFQGYDGSAWRDLH